MSLPLLLITLLILPTAYKAVRQTTCKFRFPGIITLFSVGIYGASFAPWVFSRGVEAANPSGGNCYYVWNALWMIFVILWFFNVIYWIGWGVNCFSEDRTITVESVSKKLKLSFYGVLLFMGLFWSMRLERIRDYTSPRLLWHILNGNAEHYYTAMLEREEILLDNPDELLVVPKIEMPIPTSGGGDIVEDANNWVNEEVKDYYHLKIGVRVE
jgi:hypothetical protein